jgi:outer membrane protein OmpA-like peptidoglycan-associated protein
MNMKGMSQAPPARKTQPRGTSSAAEAYDQPDGTGSETGLPAGRPFFLAGFARQLPGRGTAIQRECDGCSAGAPCAHCAERDDKLTALGVHPKLSISQPGEAAEIEADRVAEHVMRMPAGTHSEPPGGGAFRGAAVHASTFQPSFLVPSRASGRPLSADARQFFEPRFGCDLRDVRIHDDSAAAASAQRIHARAYTHGRQVVFGAGQYAPDHAAGRRLLAHELAHVLQQRSGRAQISAGPQQSVEEQRRRAHDVTRGDARHTSARGVGAMRSDVTPLSLQRQSEPEAQRAPAPELSEPQHSAAGLPLFLRQPAADAGAVDAGAPAGAPAPADAGGGPPGGVPTTPAPTGPDACATAEEEERKTRFRARTFSRLDFRPATGFGKFDTYYWPASSLMAAIVKMKFNYVQADNTPPVSTLWSMLFSGQDITKFFWTDTEKEQFAREYRERVIARWSFAHTFRSTKPCWPFTVMPYLAPRIVDDAADAHFNVTVHKSAGPGIDYKSVFFARNPGTAGWRGRGDLWQSDIREEPNFRSRSVAQTERQRLETAITAAGASPVLFDKDSAVLLPGAVTALAALATAMKAKNPSDPAIPITITGSASSEGPLIRNNQLAQDRADAVANALSAAGVPQPLTTVNAGPVGAPDDPANRKAEIVASTTFEGTYASNRYSVGEHEFGHTIGLPDEYQNNTTGVLGGFQSSFVSLVQAAGVAPPDQWGVDTSSQMSAGVDVLPRHYVTLWDALGQMTSPDILRSEWSID